MDGGEGQVQLAALKTNLFLLRSTRIVMGCGSTKSGGRIVASSTLLVGVAKQGKE